MSITFHLEEIAKVAEQFWQSVGDNKVIALHGPMGAGKTTFVHALCDARQVTSPVSSPTFSIINEYTYPGGIIYHIDLYRLEQEEDAFRAGVEDCLYSGHTCLVEWPEKAEGLFPLGTIHARIELAGPHKRILTIDNS